jgi:hypothetical protein
MSVVVGSSQRRLVLGTVMLATFMAAIETIVVATAMPLIVGQLGGFSYYAGSFRLSCSHRRPRPPSTESSQTCSVASLCWSAASSCSLAVL